MINPDVNCIVNVHLEYGATRTYRMEISAVSNAVILDLYNY